MSRIRSTHPGLWTDERFVSVSPHARLLFMGLWNECDDYGAFEWSPLKLKMRLLPADPVDAADLLAELERAGSVLRYEVDGRSLGAVRNFCRFQRPKKPGSTFPLSDAARGFVALDARAVRDGAAAAPVPDLFGTGPEKSRQREDEGGEREDVPAKAGVARAGGAGTRLDADFSLPEDWRVWAAERRGWNDADVDAEALLFANHWQSRGGRSALRLDWFKTWQNWVLVSHRKERSARGASAAPGQLPPEEQIVRLERSADWFERHDRADDARDCRRRAGRLREGTGPQRSVSAALPAQIARLARGAASGGKNGQG